MAGQFDVNIAQFSLGTFTRDANGTIPLMPISYAGGAITLLSAHLGMLGTATGTINAPVLISMTPLAGTGLGTPAMAGTLGTCVNYTPAVNVVRGIELTADYIQPGTAGAWLGLEFAKGTILTGDVALTIAYVMGR